MTTDEQQKGTHKAHSKVYHQEFKRLNAKGANGGKAKEGPYKKASAHVKAMYD